MNSSKLICDTGLSNRTEAQPAALMYGCWRGQAIILDFIVISRNRAPHFKAIDIQLSL